jgi:Tfp pilus assembly protein PilV
MFLPACEAAQPNSAPDAANPQNTEAAASLLISEQFQLQVDVRSSWKQQQPPTVSKAIATDPQQCSEAEVQTTDRADAAVQATAGPHGTSAKARVDAASVSAFLEHAGSSMLSELAANVDYAAGRSRHTRKAGSEVRHCSSR